MSSLAEAFPKEQARLRELIQTYRELPNGIGAFGAAMIEATLREADAAAAEQDLARMIAAFKAMQDCE